MAALGLPDDDPADARSGRAERGRAPARARVPAVVDPHASRRGRAPGEWCSAPARSSTSSSTPALAAARRDPVLARARLSRARASCSRECYLKRFTIDRHKLEAANAALWKRRRLPVRAGRACSWRSRSRSSTRSTRPGGPSTGARSRWARATATSACTSTTSAHDFEGPGPARRRVRALPRGRRALPSGPLPGLGRGRGVRRLDPFRRRRAATPTATGFRPCSAGTCAPAPRAGGLRARRRHGVSRAVLHRGEGAPRRVRGGPARDGTVGR